MVGGVRSLFEPKPDQQFLYAFTQPGYITFILLGLASAFNVVYRRAYQNQEGQRRARLAKRYEQEVNDWVSSNPEHPISERYREKLREEKEKDQFLKLSDREKRALAAERRLLAHAEDAVSRYGL